MTGYGEARHQDPNRSILVEIRSVNNRHLKLTCRLSDAAAACEPDIERLVRERIRRGTVQLTVRVDRPRRAEDYRLNLVALESYRRQLQDFLGLDSKVDPALLLALPGLVEDRGFERESPHEEAEPVLQVVRDALARFEQSRAAEGRAMGDELASLGAAISDHLARVIARAPLVVAGYQSRLEERIRTLLASQTVPVEARDLVREVAIFSDRSDVSEEITRLRAHLEQFQDILKSESFAGRKLEFVVQEMGRETNTLGSKSYDVEMSREVVEMKGLLERIRELIQNIE
jgi:uncharacterized protein (TIGR00255 family)